MRSGLYNTRADGCWICQNPTTHQHHIYPGVGRRDISDREGAYVYLCPNHHNMSNFGVHFDKKLDTFFREDCQRRWERREIDEHNAEHAEEIKQGEVAPMTQEDARGRFIATFCESYLGDEDD